MKKLFKALAQRYKTLAPTDKKKIWIITACTFVMVLLVIFEPFTPYYAFGVLLLVIINGILIVRIFHNRGIKVIPFLWHWVRSNKRKTVLSVSTILLIWGVVLFTPFGDSPFSGLSRDELRAKIDLDYNDLKLSIFKMDNVLRGLQNYEDLFNLEDLKNLSSDDRSRVTRLWGEFMEHIILYDLLVSEYRFFYRIAPFSRAALHDKAYLTGYTAFISRYLYAWKVLSLFKDNEIWETILNEKDSVRGIVENSYANVKNNVSSPNEIARLTIGYAHLNFLKARMDDVFKMKEGELFTYVDSCFFKCAGNLALKSAVYIPKNGIDSFKKKTFQIWFPIQKGAAGITGHIRLTAREDNYISAEDLGKFEKLLEPGDILVERRNWYLSNVGIPGFWPHAALYTGTRDKFLEYFKDDPGVAGVLKGNSIEHYLEKNFSPCWGDLKNDLCIIEAIAPGVVLNTLEKSAGADYAASMRPILSKKDKFLALCAAFTHYRKPYDYNFDFITDSELVCTELVFKSYLNTEAKRGITFPLTKHAGRDLCTAQIFVEMFDLQFDKPEKQLEFGAFLDFKPEKGTVVFATAEDFRNSWKRPKWSVLLE